MASPGIRTDNGVTILTEDVLEKQNRSLLELMKARIPSITKRCRRSEAHG